MNDKDLEIVIDRLLSGETPEVVSHDYPLHRDEIFSQSRMLTTFTNFRKETPNPVALQSALSSIRIAESKKKATPSPFAFLEFSHTTIYRSAFVIPLLFIALIAGGAYLYPWHKAEAPGTQTTPTAQSGAVTTDQVSTFAQSTGSPSPMAKTMALKPQEPPQLPQDQALSDVVAPEITQDNQAVDDDASQAGEATDDTSAVEPYNNVYDAQSF